MRTCVVVVSTPVHGLMLRGTVRWQDGGRQMPQRFPARAERNSRLDVTAVLWPCFRGTVCSTIGRPCGADTVIRTWHVYSLGRTPVLFSDDMLSGVQN